MVAYNADRATDVRATARKCTDKKRLVAETDLGKEEIRVMSEVKVEDALCEVVEEMCDDPDALDTRFPGQGLTFHRGRKQPAIVFKTLEKVVDFLGSDTAVEYALSLNTAGVAGEGETAGRGVDETEIPPHERVPGLVACGHIIAQHYGAASSIGTP
ncbi:hypothetical protein B0H11DRAFT_1909411 [Mycena galericulata]|nr:hypothetical protein B0H11DRAFT_1909411 [Mycena galericulata]